MFTAIRTALRSIAAFVTAARFAEAPSVRVNLACAVILAAVVAVLGTAEARNGQDAAQVLPTVSDVLPEIIPMDLTGAGSIVRAAEVVIVAAPAARTAHRATTAATAAPALVWTCGAPLALLSDETGTARRCEWKPATTPATAAR